MDVTDSSVLDRSHRANREIPQVPLGLEGLLGLSPVPQLYDAGLFDRPHSPRRIRHFRPTFIRLLSLNHSSSIQR